MSANASDACARLTSFERMSHNRAVSVAGTDHLNSVLGNLLLRRFAFNFLLRCSPHSWRPPPRRLPHRWNIGMLSVRPSRPFLSRRFVVPHASQVTTTGPQYHRAQTL